MSTAALTGLRILVPRAPHQARELSERIVALGGVPVEAPTIDVAPGDTTALAAALREVADGAYVAVCLTSPNGVVAVADALDGLGLDPTAVFGAVGTVACVGPGTARVLRERLSVEADLVPATSTTAALAEAFPPGGGRVLLARADLASPVLFEVLRAKGYEPEEVVAYRTVRPDRLPDRVLDDLAAGRIDLLAFASPSTVRNFVALVEDREWSGRVVSIGPITSAACRELGVEVAVEATSHDLDGLVGALVTAAEER